MGSVEAARRVTLSPEVTGRIVEVNPAVMPGGSLEAGKLLVRLDDRDYRLAVDQAQAAVEARRSELKIEEGRAVVARREWDGLAGRIDARGRQRKPRPAKAPAGQCTRGPLGCGEAASPGPPSTWSAAPSTCPSTPWWWRRERGRGRGGEPPRPDWPRSSAWIASGSAWPSPWRGSTGSASQGVRARRRDPWPSSIRATRAFGPERVTCSACWAIWTPPGRQARLLVAV